MGCQASTPRGCVTLTPKDFIKFYMRFKMGIFGSAEGNLEKIFNKAHLLGKELGKQNIIVITGASTGLPYEVAKTAKAAGAEIWGYSQATNLKDQEKLSPGCDSSIYKKLIFVPKNYRFANNNAVCKKYRNVTSTATCDAGIIIAGRWGTLNEFTNLYDMGKVIGVLTGTGGIADELQNLSKKINKKSKAKILFNDSPAILVKGVLHELSTKA